MNLDRIHEKRRLKATILQMTRPHMATQEHTRPQKIIQGKIWAHKATQGHTRPQTIQFDTVMCHKKSLSLFELHFNLLEPFLFPYTILVTFGKKNAHVSITPTTRRKTTKLLLGPLSVARGKKSLEFGRPSLMVKTIPIIRYCLHQMIKTITSFFNETDLLFQCS